MPNPAIDIAQALANLINAESAWTAERVNVPMLRKETLPKDEVVIQVLPIGWAQPDGQQSRGAFVQEYTIAVAMYARASTLTEEDAAMDSLDDLRQFLTAKENSQFSLSGDPNYSSACLTNTVINEPMVDVERLKDANIFQSVIMLNYLIYRRRD